MFLPQRPYMILGSLRDQLRYPSAGHATEEEQLEALKEVNLVDLPARFGGLDAEMHWVDVLSAGEQQRLAFARLLLNRPRYAFLDEATSALDPVTEAKVTAALDEVMKGRTTFVIAHRLATVRNATRILVFKDGRIIESGTFDKLAARRGFFAELVEAQFSLPSPLPAKRGEEIEPTEN
jgi:ATP-binding cassette subfamily B protein